MAKRFPFVTSSTELAKHLNSSIPTISILSTNTACFSTAHPSTQGGEPVTEATETRDGRENPAVKVEYRAKADGREESGVTGFMADAAKQGTGKGTEVLESAGGAAKETVDTAWDAAKKAAQIVRETTMAEADTNVVDTVEYRCAGDLKGQLGDGYDKKIEL